MTKRAKITSPFLLATNLRRWMDNSVTLHTQTQVAAISGVKQTAVSLMLRPAARAPLQSGKTPSPKLAEVESVARAFGMEVWQLLIDPNTFGEVLARAVSSPLMLTLTPARDGKDAPPDVAPGPTLGYSRTQKTNPPTIH